MSTSGRPPSNISYRSSPSSSSFCKSQAISLLAASTQGSMPASEWHSLRASSGFPFSSQGDADLERSDEYVAGLAERMASFTFQEEEDGGSAEQSKICQKFLLSSPQSILTGCGRSNNDMDRNGGSFSSPCTSGLSSPPSSPSNLPPLQDDVLHSLCAELMRLRMEREMMLRAAAEAALITRAYTMSNWTHDPSLGVRDVPLGCGRCKISSLAEHQLTDDHEAAKIHKSTWPMQMRHQQSNSSFKPKAGMPWGHAPSYGFPNASYSGVIRELAMRSGSGMRAVFLDGKGSRESGGTGVFLPRRNGQSLESRRKSACSTVLLPSHIVEALNLNIDDTVACPVSALSMLKTQREGYGHPNLNRSTPLAPSPSELHIAPADINLPSEWMY